jgi:hypothetical protein
MPANGKRPRCIADCYVLVEAVLYSAPHIHRHKKLRIKLTENQVEIFLNLERLAIHPRSRHRDGRRIFIDAHFPPASQAYYEATPQKLLSQSRFIHPELNPLFVDTVQRRCLRHLRRCAGLRPQLHEGDQHGRSRLASLRIARPSPPCVATTSSACRTSRRCSPRRNRRRSPMASARSCAAPATPCCVTSAPRSAPSGTPLPSPSSSGDLKL